MSKSQQSWLWLLLWTLLGAMLRLTHLDGKPPWTDEFRTLVLSLGNSFQSVPIDRLINLQDLFAPLIPNPYATIDNIVKRVAIEDRQPPIYFVLTYLWLKLFPPVAGTVDLWAARALPALTGILAIPCTYICSYWLFRPQFGSEEIRDDRIARSIANFSAAMLAVSPYGVFISQEARQYSLAIIWVIISISCLAIACRYFAARQKLPFSIIWLWIVANVLGMGTHYFFIIALAAEVISLGAVWWWQRREISPAKPDSECAALMRLSIVPPGWPRLLLILFGTLAGAAIWWWLWAHNYDRLLNVWIDNQPRKLIDTFNPIFQIIGATISMMSLLLVESTEFPPIYVGGEVPIDTNIPIVIVSAILMAIFSIWAIPSIRRGIRYQLRQPAMRIGTMAIISLLFGSICLYLAIAWLTGMDITRGARYHFVYFPMIIIAIGLSSASFWHGDRIAKWVSGKQAVTIVLSMGLISSAIVATNYGYHKYYRPEIIVPQMAKSAPMPILIATTHNSAIQVGEMMGLAWEIRRQQAPILPQFLLASQLQKFCDRDCPATKLLREQIDRISRSIDLWLINFYAPVSLPPACERDKKFTRGVYGYQYQLYHCQPLKDIAS